MPLPDVNYARSGDVAIAYQVVGAGAPDVVFMRGIAGDLVSTWDQPLLVRHVQGLADCGRVLMLDKRGTGLSDRVREVQSLETTMDDVRAVMDAVGSERAVLWTGATEHGHRRALRGDLSGTLCRSRPLRPEAEGSAFARLPVGSDRGGMEGTARRGARRLGGARLPRELGTRVGAGGRRRPALP